MKRAAVLVVFALFLCSVIYSPAIAGNDKDLLRRALQKKQEEKKVTQRPNSKLIIMDELREEFKKLMISYLSENKDEVLSYFSDDISQAYLNDNGDRAFKNLKKADYAKQLADDFKYQDLTQAKYEECFDPESPRMMFVLSYEQISESNVPVWSFSIDYRDIARQMKAGEYVVVANTLPDSIDKVSLPLCMYYIYKRVDDKWKVVGMGI